MSCYPDDGPLFPGRKRSLFSRRLFSSRLLLTGVLLFIVLFTNILASFPLSSFAFAAARGNPNPPIPAPDWLQTPQQQPSVDLGHYGTANPDGKTPPLSHTFKAATDPITISLTAQEQNVMSGQLEVKIAAGTVTDEQINAAGGTISLVITQILPGSGGAGSEHIFFGTYQVVLQDASGTALTNLVLAQPIAFSYHLLDEQAPLMVDGQEMYALWVDGGTSINTPSSVATRTKKTASGDGTSQLLVATKDTTGMVWSVPSFLSASPPAGTATKKSAPPTTHVTPTVKSTPSPKASPTTKTTAKAKARPITTAPPTVQPTVTPSTHTSGKATDQTAQAQGSITFGTTAPKAAWGTPQDFQVALNAGGLSYNYPLNIPPGPGGLTPQLALSYSSGAVNESHNVQATAPWVGEGWNLSMGSISWSQENVLAGLNQTKLQSVWNINDPSGIGGQLIPPTLTTSTVAPLSPWPLDANTPYLWHTAPESHARVQEYNFGNYPCWRVWLPNGVMEEFGCTNPSRQSYQVNSKATAYRWDLDLMTDRFGNQVHVNYKQDFSSDNTYVRDAAISTIEYDDPNCHNSDSMCSGNNWHPQVVIAFDSSNKPHHFTDGSNGHAADGHCDGWKEEANGTRCDSPVDISGGLPASKVSNAYVLNQVQVKVQGNILHQYDLSYEQQSPQTITDPVSGSQESIAGYLDLTKIEESGTNGNSLNAPKVTVNYTQQTQHYVDNSRLPVGQNNCGPAWNQVNCILWSQSYTSRYIQTLDNGRGWHETITWKEAHNNTYGVSTGAANDTFACDGHEGDGPCHEADNLAWSRQIVSQREAVSNGVTSTWGYQYYLRDNLPAFRCDACRQGYVWGNINDVDYADYYNAQFQGFYRAKVTQPDKSYQIHRYESTDGWGVATGINCNVSPCHDSPYWSPGNLLAGKDQEELDYDKDNRLLSAHTWSYGTNCPPPGVSPTGANGGGASGFNPGLTQLISQLDQNNPVVVCDPRVNQEDSYQVDGATDANGYANNASVVHKQVNYTYDGDNQGSTQSANYDYGNTSRVDATGNDVNGWHFVTAQATFPYDELHATSGIYLVSLPSTTQEMDGAGHPLTCHENIYGTNTTVAASIYPDITRSLDHPSTSGCNGGVFTVQRNYDAQGNMLDSTDADNHQGCNSNGSQHTGCAQYDDGTYATHMLKATNAKGQTTTNTYENTAAGGWGQWLSSTKDSNGQTTTYQYDILGRLTNMIRPGDSTSSPTVSYSYNKSCAAGTTTPCLELDTATRFTVGGPTSVTREWYDGWGHLVETRTPGPNTGQDLVTYATYDSMGRAELKSLPYSVAGGPGYVTPDLNKARSQTTYDGLGRSLGGITYDSSNHIVLRSDTSYSVAQGLPGFNVDTATAFERTTALDAYHHQSIQYSDAIGRHRYEQVFSGTGDPYHVIRTVQYNQDQIGNMVEVVTYDSAGNGLARYEATYDGLKRRLGFNDFDQGTCTTSPRPASCSSSSDTAWKFSYDANSNMLSQTDPRNVTTHTSYDTLDRPLCRGTSSAQVNPCQSTAYAAFFYDSYNNASNSTLTLPSGCNAPTGGSFPVGHPVAETFSGAAGSGWRCSGFDERGQQTASTLSVTTDGQTTTQTVGMSYNDGGEVTTLTYPDSETLTSQYDANGRFQSAYFGTSASADPVAFLVGQASYTNTGQLSGLSVGGSGNKGSTPTAIFSTTVSYDGIQRPEVSDATRTGSGSSLWHQNRVYDNVGNVLSMNTALPTVGGGSQSDNQVFCYDALNRLAWAGNSGTPTGGDHCALAPSGSSTTNYQQPFSYDAIDRLTQGNAGTISYNSSHTHAATGLSSVPTPYASYDAMGNMTCRNTDTTGAQSCAAGGQTGALMSYDNEGRLSGWTAPSGQNTTDQFLYDNEGNRVLQHSSVTDSTGTSTSSDTITFDGYTEIVMKGITSAITKYYGAAGQRLAMRIGSTLSYLLPDFLGSSSVALNYDGTIQAVQLFAPYGAVRYSEGTMPTTYNFTGQRLDTVTGLLYFNARYYDPVSGRFSSADSVQNNMNGMDPYAYVKGNPLTMTDPSGKMVVDAGGGNDVGGGGGGGSSPAPAPTPAPDAPSGGGNWWDNPLGAIQQFGSTVLDATTGIPSMIKDVQTVFDGSKSWQDRFLAGGDFLLNATMDVTMLIGVGEVARGLYMAAHIGVDIIEHTGVNVLEHAGADAVAHAATDTTEHAAADTAQHAAAGCGGGLSFTATTMVATAAGAQAIATLHPGDQVWAYNPESKKMELEPVLHVWINHDDDLVDFTLTANKTKDGKVAQSTDEVLHTNKKHPFLTTEKGFLPVGEIKPGMHVVQADGQVGVVTGWKLVPGVMVMYNLEVAHDHTFVVGDGQWVVHNCNPGNLVNTDARRIAQNLSNAFNDHLTSSDLSGAWRDLHGDPVPRPGGGFFNHIGEVNDALRSGENAINGFKSLLNRDVLSEADRCIVQCLISRTSKSMDYVSKVITRNVWHPGASILPFP